MKKAIARSLKVPLVLVIPRNNYIAVLSTMSCKLAANEDTSNSGAVAVDLGDTGKNERARRAYYSNMVFATSPSMMTSGVYL